MAIGIPYETFKHLNPTKLKPFFEAHKLKRKMRDEEMWYLGQYIMSALDSTVCNGFVWRKKGSKPGKYIEKPFMQQLEERKNKKELTEEEKKKQTEQLFMRLRLMQSNFNLNHKDGKGS